jgi:hypothetical protein
MDNRRMNGRGRPRTLRPFPVHPDVAKAYAEAREHPYPDHIKIMHLAFDAMLERLPLKLQQQIRQDMQALAAVTRRDPSQISREAQKQVITDILTSIAQRPVIREEHDSHVLKKQRSIIDHYLQRHPFPTTARNTHTYDVSLRDQQQAWLKEYSGELWILLDAEPCVCRYRKSLDRLSMPDVLTKNYTENEIVFDILLELHIGLSSSALEKALYLKHPSHRSPK